MSTQNYCERPEEQQLVTLNFIPSRFSDPFDNFPTHTQSRIEVHIDIPSPYNLDRKPSNADIYSHPTMSDPHLLRQLQTQSPNNITSDSFTHQFKLSPILIPEILSNIFHYLNHKDLTIVRWACRIWMQTARDSINSRFNHVLEVVLLMFTGDGLSRTGPQPYRISRNNNGGGNTSGSNNSSNSLNNAEVRSNALVRAMGMGMKRAGVDPMSPAAKSAILKELPYMTLADLEDASTHNHNTDTPSPGDFTLIPITLRCYDHITFDDITNLSYSFKPVNATTTPFNFHKLKPDGIPFCYVNDFIVDACIDSVVGVSVRR
ncbi:hypothetical protein HDU76_011497, partial [Blyttiomyces sp. JEL0837]